MFTIAPPWPRRMASTAQRVACSAPTRSVSTESIQLSIPSPPCGADALLTNTLTPPKVASANETKSLTCDSFEDLQEVVRAQGKEPKDNPRFVITNLPQSPQWIYEQLYCRRGETENRIKELHDLEIDRTSCSQFWTNQFRVLLTAAADVLMQELRLRAAGTACARAQVWMLRERLLKLGAHVVGSVRRVVVHLPAAFPFLPTFRQVALALGALPG
jgi:hypothetical protein